MIITNSNHSDYDRDGDCDCSINPYMSIKNENGEQVSHLPMQNSALGGRNKRIFLQQIFK